MASTLNGDMLLAHCDSDFGALSSVKLLWFTTHRLTTCKQQIQMQFWEVSPTISSIDHGTPRSRKATTINGFVNGLLVPSFFSFATIAMTKEYFELNC